MKGEQLKTNIVCGPTFHVQKLFQYSPPNFNIKYSKCHVWCMFEEYMEYHIRSYIMKSHYMNLSFVDISTLKLNWFDLDILRQKIPSNSPTHFFHPWMVYLKWFIYGFIYGMVDGLFKNRIILTSMSLGVSLKESLQIWSCYEKQSWSKLCEGQQCAVIQMFKYKYTNTNKQIQIQIYIYK